MLARLYNTVSKYRWIEMDQERLCGCELFWGGYYFDSETYGWIWTELMNLFSVIINSRVYISVKKINRILRCRQVHSTINSSSIHKPQSAIELPGGVNPYIYRIQSLWLRSGRVFAPLWSENGYTLCPIRCGVAYGLRRKYGSVWTYLSFQFQISKKEREIC